MQHYVFSWIMPHVSTGMCSVVATTLEEATSLVSERLGPNVQVFFDETLPFGTVHVVTTDQNNC